MAVRLSKFPKGDYVRSHLITDRLLTYVKQRFDQQAESHHLTQDELISLFLHRQDVISKIYWKAFRRWPILTFRKEPGTIRWLYFQDLSFVRCVIGSEAINDDLF